MVLRPTSTTLYKTFSQYASLMCMCSGVVGRLPYALSIADSKSFSWWLYIFFEDHTLWSSPNKFLLTIQVASLKSTIAKKDEEIEQLQLLKGLKSVHPGSYGEKRGTATRYASSSPRRETAGGTTLRSQEPLGGKGLAAKSASDPDIYSELSDKHSEDDSQNSMDDFKYQNELVRQSKVAGDTEIIGLGDADYDERSSDISDGGLSMGTDTDGSVEGTFTPETTKRSDILEK